jgi:diadenosine tetraphosphate (Ap4A) HIT family hydrolase
VDHVHFHIIPRVEGDGLGYRWNPKKYPEGKDKQVLQKIISNLK